jgi:hypothetical protein
MSDAATIGHNQAPDATAILRAQLEETHKPLLDRQAQLLGMEARLPATCDDEDTAAKFADAIKACTAYTKNSEATRLSANEPYRAGIRTVDGFFKANSDPVDKLKTKMGGILTDYQRRVADAERRRLEVIAAEERRIAKEAEAKAREEARVAHEGREAEERRQEEARKAAEALGAAARKKAEEVERKRQEEAAAAQKKLDDAAAKARDDAREKKQNANVAKADSTAKGADLSRSRSTAGSVASLRTTWEFSVVNADDVPRTYMSVNEGAIRVAIKAATTKDGKCPLRIPGVKIFPVEETVVR